MKEKILNEYELKLIQLIKENSFKIDDKKIKDFYLNLKIKEVKNLD